MDKANAQLAAELMPRARLQLLARWSWLPAWRRQLRGPDSLNACVPGPDGHQPGALQVVARLALVSLPSRLAFATVTMVYLE
jgi:hypothetical protein